MKFDNAIRVLHKCYDGMDGVIRMAQNSMRYSGDLSLEPLFENRKVNILSTSIY